MGVLIWAGLLKLVAHPITGEQRRVLGWLAPMIFFMALAAVNGLIHGNNLLFWTLIGFLPFMSVFVVFLALQEGVFPRLQRTLLLQTALGTLFTVFVLLFHPPASRVEWYGESAPGWAMSATISMFGLPFVFGCWQSLKWWGKGIAISGLMAYAMLAIVGENRGMALVAAVLIPGATFVGVLRSRREASARRVMGLVAVTAIAVCATLIVARVSDAFSDYMEEKWEALSVRLTGGEQGASSGVPSEFYATGEAEFFGGGGRATESQAFLDETVFLDYLIGRGFGGTWSSEYRGADWNMVHFGPLHFILLGGLPLLLTYLLVQGRALSGAWKGLANEAALPALCQLVCYVESFIQHGPLDDSPAVILMWCSIGYGLAAWSGDRG
jgi:hypothetical protein